MSIRAGFWPMGGANKCPYKKGEVIFDGKNGDTAVVHLYKGFYYIRGQGPGGIGGNNDYFNNGGGGGSGAGFEGLLYITKTIKDVPVVAGVAGNKTTASTNTFIGNIMILSAGQNGKSGAGGIGGIFQFNPELRVNIISFKIQSNGETGQFSNAGAPDDRCRGGHSVLTNNGGGFGGSDESVKATAPGAGGGGQIQWGASPGVGMYGELLIRYEGNKLPKELLNI